MIGGTADELSVDELLAKLAEKGKKVKVLDENGEEVDAVEEEELAVGGGGDMNDRADEGPQDAPATKKGKKQPKKQQKKKESEATGAMQGLSEAQIAGLSEQ